MTAGPEYQAGIEAGRAAAKPATWSSAYVGQPASVSARPPCFTVAQWVLWRTPHNSAHVPAKHCCEDCTPEYQAEMLAAKRCDHPETTFIRDADGFISGHRPPITNQEKS